MAANSSCPLSASPRCAESAVGLAIMNTFISAKCLCVPLHLHVLHLGLQRWRRRRSLVAASPSDVFTYHLTAMELMFTLGALLFFSGQYAGRSEVMTVGKHLFSSVVLGETAFHVFTCVERYLAVVHPVTYMRLRESRGVRIRNMSAGCAWLLYLGWIGLRACRCPDAAYVPFFAMLTLALAVVSVCSLSVLCALIRPGPGQVGGGRARLDQSKRRAFRSITGILGALWLFFLGFLVCMALSVSNMLPFSGECLILLFGNFVALPSSLVLTLLFLHRARKLACCHSRHKKAIPAADP